jgi:ribose 5-phosphate isomerase B
LCKRITEGVGHTAVFNYLYPIKTYAMSCAFNLALPVAIGSDHAGYEYKEAIISFLDGKSVTWKDFGTFSPDSVDYPDFAHPVANAVENKEAAYGILICGSANGVAITANKHQHIRAAICWGEEITELSRKHNNANIICIPARFVREGLVEKMIEIFMHTDFEGGRHKNRVDKIACSGYQPA